MKIMKNCTTLDMSIEAQYSYEFGLMMARKRYWRRRDGCILSKNYYDSDSSECLLSLV
jgi:hypothetical protein